MEQCAATVWKHDTYRRTGRGKDGFEMHFYRCRCRHKATDGKWCWQHSNTDSEYERTDKI